VRLRNEGGVRRLPDPPDFRPVIWETDSRPMKLWNDIDPRLDAGARLNSTDRRRGKPGSGLPGRGGKERPFPLHL